MGTKKIIDAWIFARGGSKGCPRKNVRLLNGKPLIAHAIEVGKQCPYINNVFVSTDDKEIAEVSEQYGAIVPFLRPIELAQDTSPEHKAWQHAVRWMQNQSEYPMMDIMVSLPTVAPLRTVEDVNRGIETFLEKDCDVVVSVTEAARHPCFNMVKQDDKGYVSLLMPNEHVYRRQDAPKIYDVTTAFYITTSCFVLNADSLWEGKICQTVISRSHAIDIDTELDFLMAETILKYYANK